MKPGSFESASEKRRKSVQKRSKHSKVNQLTILGDFAGRYVVASDDIDAKCVSRSGVETTRFADDLHAAFGREMNSQGIIDDRGNLKMKERC